MTYKYQDDTYRQRINDHTRIIPAAPGARMCTVWRGEVDKDGQPECFISWSRILAWSVPKERGEVPIPLTVEGWAGDDHHPTRFDLIEDEDGLRLQHYGTFEKPEDAIEAIRKGELVFTHKLSENPDG